MRTKQTNLKMQTEQRKQTAPGDIERRTLRGYALKFGSVYDMGWFTEEVDRRALDEADMSDVRVLLNHDPNQILGRTAAKTARVGVDNVGLWYEVELPDSPNGQNARVAIERGDITQSSWGFMLRYTKDSNGDRWEKKDGKEHRILTDVKAVFDASPVTFPANPDTTVAKRNFEIQSKEEYDQQRTAAEQNDIETQIEIALLERQFSSHLFKTR